MGGATGGCGGGQCPPHFWDQRGTGGTHGRRKRGYAGDLTPRTIYVGDIDMYIPLEKPNTVTMAVYLWSRCLHAGLECEVTSLPHVRSVYTMPCKLYATRTEMLGKAI